MFKGSNVALLTPFKNNKLDEDCYIKLINFHIENGTNGLVPAGTTGESPTLSHEEHEKVIELCIKEAKGKIPIIAGTGSNSTTEAVVLTKHAEKAGADGVLVVTPYYNKPTQEGLYQHYKKINDNVGIPIIIYNIPSRSVIDMSVDTMSKLYELKKEVEYKDGTRRISLAQFSALKHDGTELTWSLIPKYHIFMCGLGYMHPEWGHGQFHGENQSLYDFYDLSEDPHDPPFLHIQAICDVELLEGKSSKKGIGALEQLLIGPHLSSGFESLLDT